MSECVFSGQYPVYLTASGVVTARPARLVKVIVTVALSAAAVTFYDNASAASGNVVSVVPASTTAGTIYAIDWPCINGIYASFAGTGTLAILFSDGVN